jgi:hypothetical protein
MLYVAYVCTAWDAATPKTFQHKPSTDKLQLAKVECRSRRYLDRSLWAWLCRNRYCDLFYFPFVSVHPPTATCQGEFCQSPCCLERAQIPYQGNGEAACNWRLHPGGTAGGTGSVQEVYTEFQTGLT